MRSFWDALWRFMWNVFIDSKLFGMLTYGKKSMLPGIILRLVVLSKCRDIGVFEILRLAFETGLRLVKKFVHSWNLSCCLCTETCSHVLSIQDDIAMSRYWINVNIYFMFWVATQTVSTYRMHQEGKWGNQVDRWCLHFSYSPVNKIKVFRADSRFVSSQWVTSLQSNAVSYWLGANLESALISDI